MFFVLSDIYIQRYMQTNKPISYFSKIVAESIVEYFSYIIGKTFQIQFGELPIDELKAVQISQDKFDVIIVSYANIEFREMYQVLNLTSMHLVDYFELTDKKLYDDSNQTTQVYYTESIELAKKICQHYSYLIAEAFVHSGFVKPIEIDFIKPIEHNKEVYQIVIGHNIFNHSLIYQKHIINYPCLDLVQHLNQIGSNDDELVKHFITLYL
jgi:hypothetical protein